MITTLLKDGSQARNLSASMLSVEPLIVDDLHAVCRVQVNTRLGHQGHNNWIDPNVLTKGLDYPSQSVNYSVFDPLSTFTGLPEYVHRGGEIS
jgi:hypothetical protein